MISRNDVGQLEHLVFENIQVGLGNSMIPNIVLGGFHHGIGKQNWNWNQSVCNQLLLYEKKAIQKRAEDLVSWT